jgi:hypothetical protein
MVRFGPKALALSLLVAAGCLAIAACGTDDVAPFGGSKKTNSASGKDDPDANPNKISPEEEKFRLAEPGLVKSCGRGQCHDLATYSPTPPAFLAPPDSYKSIKAQTGIVVRDVFASALLIKGPHAGPALSEDAETEKKVTEWLEAEAILIQSQKLPSTPPFTVSAGPNDIDLTPASVGGLTGVHLKFEAALIGTILSLTKLTLVAPAGTDVHVLQPRFVRISAKPNADGSAAEVVDPADSFSNSDQTVPGGKESLLAPGAVVFSNASWRPYDLAGDKLRIEFAKLEPGKVSVIQAAPTCKNASAFAAQVLPAIRQQATSVGGTCQGCHGEGLANLNLNSQDANLVCQQVLQKLTQANVPQSIIVTKVSGGMAHQGGTVGDPNAWRALFVNNAAVFF